MTHLAADPSLAPPSDDISLQVLARRVAADGLQRHRLGWYCMRVAVTGVALAASVAFMFLSDSWPLQLLNAVVLAFLLGQVALLGHDAGHRQVSRKRWINSLAGFTNNLVVGASFTWWVDAHDRHHGKPNQLGADPAVDFDFIAVSPEQAASKKGLARHMVRHQALLMLPLMSLYSLSARIDSAKHILSGRARHATLEALLIATNLAVLVAVPWAALGPWFGALFLIVNQAAFGLYVASIFLPNHHGMPVLEPGVAVPFVERQVLTARNISGGVLTDIWFGGLNHQIEHHLFPQAPRANLRAIKAHVREYCAERRLRYEETSFVQAMREVFSHLSKVSRSAR